MCNFLKKNQQRRTSLSYLAGKSEKKNRYMEMILILFPNLSFSIILYLKILLPKLMVNYFLVK